MFQPQPLFSVIIPTKDRPDMLVRALKSVLAQEDIDFEIVVADDGTGEGAALAGAMVGDHRLTAFATGGLGQVPARNMAMRRAKAPWIAYLDDDDWWASAHHLAALAEPLRRHGGLAYASGRIVREGPGAGAEDWIAFKAHIDAKSIRRDNRLLISGIGYDRVLHDRLGPLDETLPVYWDWDWYLRLVAADISMGAACADGVRISARLDNVSAPANETKRRHELTRLSAKHGLVDLVLKNHEIIAIEDAEEAGTPSPRTG